MRRIRVLPAGSANESNIGVAEGVNVADRGPIRLAPFCALR
jgi:hypothetical protein